MKLVMMLLILAAATTGCAQNAGTKDANESVRQESAAAAQPQSGQPSAEADAPTANGQQSAGADASTVNEQQSAEADAPAANGQLTCASNEQARQEPVDDGEYEGFLQTTIACYSIYLPADWKVDRDDHDNLAFTKGGEQIGSAMTQAYFDENSWRSYMPNHSEVTDFRTLSSPDLAGADIYRIQLTMTKPAAAGDPDWEDRQTWLYFAVKELNVSYGFCFETADVEDALVQKIASSFRVA